MSLVEQLIRRKEDRGLMATLRCYLVESKRHRAWPALHRLGIPVGSEAPDALAASTVAALFATHPEATSSGNMGDHCRHLEKLRGEKSGDDSKMTPTERRFQILLAADRGEIHERVARIVRMAKQQGISINYAQLLTDLKYWNDRTRNTWASRFWSPNAQEQEDA
ncbi:MAG: type I-E CRISPR-associated protein Cse2/CasB [Proteobacteria bacterium]|nr:type I-E CRISPR-associated protein Cse2/CasB [Pseudomonadota bacterium]